MAEIERIRATVCAWVGHSRFVTRCAGYRYCGRCRAQVGDTLGGGWGGGDCVIKGCRCEVCQQNYQRMGWRDRLLTPKSGYL